MLQIQNHQTVGVGIGTLQPHALATAGGGVGVVHTNVNGAATGADEAVASGGRLIDVAHEAVGRVLSLR